MGISGGRRRISLTIAFVLTTSASTVAVAAPAQAISRGAAATIALRLLKPASQPIPPRVFAMPKPVARGTYVYEAGWSTPQRVQPLKTSAWLFWEDLAPGAAFAHASVLLLLDAKTGRPISRRLIAWRPYIGDRLAPFLRTTNAYNSRTYLVYAPRPKRTRHAPLARAANSYAAAKNRHAALSRDYLVNVGDFNTPNFKGSFAAMDRFADAVGLRRVDVHYDTFIDLQHAVSEMYNSGCTDIFLFVAGHGRPPQSFWQGGQRVRVAPGQRVPDAGIAARPEFVRKNGQVIDKTSYITPADLVRLVKPYSGSFGHADFKIKIDSCFAGRFETVFQTEQNVVAFEAASSADEVSFSFAVAPEKLTLPVADPHSHTYTRQTKTDTIDNPDKASDFVNANVHGLMSWAATAPPDSPLYDGITQALTAGQSFDFARALHYTHPYTQSRQPFVEPKSTLYDLGPGDFGLFGIAATPQSHKAPDAALARSAQIAFVESTQARIGLMDVGGNLKEVATAPGISPTEITYGPDGNFWFTEYDNTAKTDAIGRVTPAGVVSTFDLPAPPSSLDFRVLFGIASGPDGNIWFTERSAGKIGVMTTAGTLLHEYTVRPSPIQTFLIAKGPDRNMWFTDSNSEIGRITPAGTVSYFPLPSRGPFGITTGPDGKIWFTEQGGKAAIGRLNPDGSGYTEFPDPDNGFPNQIASGPDGNLWYVDYANSASGGDQIGRITPSGQVTEFSQGLPTDSQPTAITPGPDGRMWFTLGNANDIGAITAR